MISNEYGSAVKEKNTVQGWKHIHVMGKIVRHIRTCNTFQHTSSISSWEQTDLTPNGTLLSSWFDQMVMPAGYPS